MTRTIQLKDAWGEDVYPYVPGAGYQIFNEYNVPTDGTSDATAALQDVIDNCGGVLDFRPGVYTITGSLQVDTASIKEVRGNGAILKVNGDFPAIVLYGSGNSSFTANPSTMTEQQKATEASTIIRGLKIMSGTGSATGTGIRLTQCWTPIIENCYLRLLRVGVELYGRNRNVIIEGNNIYQFTEAGILFAQGSNTHQVNIVGNHISYGKTCLHINQPQQLANVQIVGNDIEIDNWPSGSLSAQRCIVFDYQNTSDTLCSEFEITGNTIQGHEYSNGLIDISGNASAFVENLSIGDNQISNTAGYAIKLTYCHNVTLSGNTYRRVTAKVLELAGTINGLVMSGEVAEDGTGFVNAAASAVLRAVTLNALTGRGMTGGMTISCNTIDGLSVTGCNIASSGLTISATTKDYISVVGNCLRGTYDVATATHRQFELNI